MKFSKSNFSSFEQWILTRVVGGHRDDRRAGPVSGSNEPENPKGGTLRERSDTCFSSKSEWFLVTCFGASWSDMVLL